MTSTAPVATEKGPPAVRVVGVVGSGSLARGIVAELCREGQAVEELATVPAGERLGELGCLVLADDDDARNVDVALHTREERPTLPLVVRVFDPILEEFLSTTSPDISVLSMSGVAVPALVELVDDTAMSTMGLSAWFRIFTGKLDWLFSVALGSVLFLMVGGTMFFSLTMGLSIVDSFYFVVTTVTTTGYGDITPKDHPAFVKLGAAAIMILGTSTFAVFFALVSDWVFARRLDVVLGRVPTRWTNHVVLVGAGHMSVRLARVLRERGQRTLVIEHDADNALIPVLRAAGHQVLVGDATKDQTLRLAGADRARTILVMTSEDARNLHIALIARSVSRDASVWARIDSPPLSAHVAQHSSIRASSPLLMAARAFAKEARHRAGT
jgi:voltage-gated potassium channel Kch